MKLLHLLSGLYCFVLLTGCTILSSPTKQVSPKDIFLDGVSVEIITQPRGEKTASIKTDAIGTAVWIGPNILVTTAHTLMHTGQTYLIRDSQGTICEIINTQFHPTLDLAHFEIYGACTGSALVMGNREENARSVHVQHKSTVNLCTLFASKNSIVATDCTFSRGMSGSPVIGTNQKLVGLVQGTEAHTGYLLLFVPDTVDWIMDAH